MNFLKKPAVAWVIVVVMIFAAVALGRAKAPASAVSSDAYFVYDHAGVITPADESLLSQRNRELARDMDVVIACVTTNYGRDDLYNFALDYANDLNLGEYDFIVVLDISGDNYWLVQGSGLVDVFSDDDCAYYAQTYMENSFAAGNYGDALLDLTRALSGWYYDNYNY